MKKKVNRLLHIQYKLLPIRLVPYFKKLLTISMIYYGMKYYHDHNIVQYQYLHHHGFLISS